MALVNERARILANEEVGPNLYLMELAASHIAASIEPGQFVHMKVPSMEAHILRRPFSVYARDAAAGTLEVLYQSVGFGTDHMTRIEPERAEHLSGAELPRTRVAPSSWAAAWVLRRFSCCARV